VRRGQAFEVFRLLIAAVVAGAILMVLLNILGGLTITTQDPDDFIKQSIKSMATDGGVKTSSTIVFKPGMAVNLKAAAAAATLNPDCVKKASDDSMCKSGGAADGWSCNDGICTYSGGKVRGYIAVVCNPSSGSDTSCPVTCDVYFCQGAP